MRRWVIIGLLIMFVTLTGCSGEPDLTGMVLETSDKTVKLANGLTPEAYEAIQDVPPLVLHNETVAGERDLDLYSLVYDQSDEFSRGDYVDVWIGGGIRESFPPSADAVQIKKKR